MKGKSSKKKLVPIVLSVYNNPPEYMGGDWNLYFREIRPYLVSTIRSHSKREILRNLLEAPTGKSMKYRIRVSYGSFVDCSGKKSVFDNEGFVSSKTSARELLDDLTEKSFLNKFMQCSSN